MPLARDTRQVIVTGGAGFLGARLIAALLEARGDPSLRIVSADRLPCPIDDARVESRLGSIVDANYVDAVVTEDTSIVFHLAAVLSGQAEVDFALGMQVNVDGTRHLLDACRRCATPPRVVFASTVAVFGGPLPAVVPDHMAVRPQSTYGTEKAIAELLVHEYTRRGVIDGVVCRVPTVAVRPGLPNSAVSSFVSGIVREPLRGVDSVCPVPVETPIWISAPEVVTGNLLHAGTVSGDVLGATRTINLPGVTATPTLLLESLERVAGAEARARVRLEIDPAIAEIVVSWPAAFDTDRALALGFACDRDVAAIVEAFAARLP